MGSADSILDEFGTLLVANVRDDALEYIERLLAGEIADSKSQGFHRQCQDLDDDGIALLEDLVTIAVDAAIVRFLFLLDDYGMALLVDGSDGQQHNIVDLSDGLHGELWTDDGWIQRHSRYKRGLSLRKKHDDLSSH